MTGVGRSVARARTQCRETNRVTPFGSGRYLVCVWVGVFFFFHGFLCKPYGQDFLVCTESSPEPCGKRSGTLPVIRARFISICVRI